MKIKVRTEKKHKNQKKSSKEKIEKKQTIK